MTPAQAAEYEEGQVWSYATRPGEEGSTLHIVRIDREIAEATIFHIHLTGLRIRNTQAEGVFVSEIQHSPVGRETLDASVIELVGTDSLPPDISEGYGQWRAAFDEGRAGWFTVPVREIVQFVEDVVNQQQ